MLKRLSLGAAALIGIAAAGWIGIGQADARQTLEREEQVLVPGWCADEIHVNAALLEEGTMLQGPVYHEGDGGDILTSYQNEDGRWWIVHYSRHSIGCIVDTGEPEEPMVTRY